MRKLLSLLLSALLVIVHVGSVSAQAPEQINNFRSQININRDNTATITEVIDYDFGVLDRHGIQRFVPVRTKASGSLGFYYYNFKFLSAAIDNRPVKSDIFKQGAYQVMRLGDPNAYVTGQHTYAITYQIWPVIEKDESGDYLNWNLTGNDWEVPIVNASTTVRFPDGVGVSDQRCYSGLRGSTERECRIQASGNQIVVSNIDQLNPGEGITLNALVSKGAFANYLEPNNPPLYEWLPWLGIGIGILAIIFGIMARIASWLLYRFRRSRELIIPQYEAPDKLTAGEIGYLHDNQATMTEVTATFISLAVRGYIQIEQTEPKAMFKKAKYKFRLLKSYSKLPKPEKDLLDLLFSGGKKAVNLADIKASQAAPVIRRVREQFKKDLESKQYYVAGTVTSPWKKVTRRLIWLTILAVLVANVYSLINGANSGLTIWSFIITCFGMLFGWVFARRAELTKAGYKEWANIQGLRLFLTVTEKERLKFHDAPAKNPKLFNKLLPYAVALGVERQWAKQFEGMDIEKEAGWYSGSGHFNSVYLANSLSSDFSSSVSSNFTPTQSSGGFSGGGSSGGGGGGGGGGSW